MKKIYKIAVSWQVCGEVDIEATSIEEALRIADQDDIPLPIDNRYIDASWEVDEEVSKILNDED